MRSRPDDPASSTPANRRAGTGAALLVLQFFAIGWVVLNQFRDHLGLELGVRSGLVAKGYLGAGLFFVVGGFLICRQWAELGEVGRCRHGSVLWRRLAFIYPLHLLVLVAMSAALVFNLGQPLHRTSFPPDDLPANILLAQAWGFVKTDSWNFPSWLVSAEWFAWLMFPLTAWVALRALRSTTLALAAPMVLFVTLFLIAQANGVLFTDMTAQIGALQTIPAYLLGAALWRLDQEQTLPQAAAATLAATAVAWIIAGASLRLSDILIWPAFGPLIFGLVQTIKSPKRPRDWSPIVYLGRLAVAMLLVYLPVDIAYFRTGRLLFGPLHGLQAWWLLLGVFPTILLATVVAYHGVQRPIWLWLRQLDPFGDKGQSKPGTGA
jgi:peptidoglycan/LPS O-acetylase OafA/YrhL